MSSSNTSLDVAERLFAEVWGDPKGTVPADLIHDDYWSSEPELLMNWPNPAFKGVEAVTREVAHYRGFYHDFTLSIRETVHGESALRGGLANWEVDRLKGDVVAVAWLAGATHPSATFTTRGGQSQPLTVHGEGVSLVRIVDGRVFSADKYWRPDSDILAMMSADPQARTSATST